MPELQTKTTEQVNQETETLQTMTIYKSNFLEKKDIIFLFISLLILSTFSFLLYEDIYRTQVSSQKKVGIIVFKKKNALRKIQEGSIWEILENEVPVYNGDSIKTEQLSEAVIKLNDGTDIAVNENSFIIINFTGNETKIDFNYGNIEANSAENSKIKIATKDSEIQFSSANVKIDSQKDELTLQVEKGKVNLKKGDTVQEVSQNEIAKIDKKTDTIQKEKIPIVLLEPKNNDRFISKENIYNVKFSFQGSPDERFNLFIAKNPNFRNPYRVVPITNTITLPIEEGTYYWKVVSTKEDINFYNKFTVLKSEKPKLFTPENGKVITSKESFAVNFSWSKLDLASSYEILIDKDPNFSNPQKITTLSNFIYNTFNENSQNQIKYFWKVIPKSSIENLYSDTEVFSFTLKRLAKEKPAQLVYPVNEEVLQVLIDKGINFSWNIENSSNQILEIAKDKNFQNIIYKETINQRNYFTLQEKLSAGTYFWRIINIDNESSEIAQFTLIDTVDLNLISPREDDILILTNNDNINFQWQTPGRRNLEFELVIADNPEFKQNLYRNVIKNTNINIKISDILKNKKGNTYFWKVSLLYNNNKKIKEKTRKFLIYTTPNKPIITEPQNGAKFNPLKINTINFRWIAVPDADSYEVQIIKDNKILFTANTKETYFNFINFNLLQEGIHSFNLRSIRNIKNQILKSDISSINFNIENQIEKIPEFLTPEKIIIE